jgi:DNA-binding GntR family transcriptional regulator
MTITRIRQNIGDQIVSRIRSDVLSGRLQPGSSVIERVLAEEFRVSHTPIREAIRQLCNEGLLVLHRNRGAKVAPPADGSVRELFLPIRQNLEAYAVRTCAERFKEAHFARLEGLLQELRFACDRRDLGAVAENDFHFHGSLIHFAGEQALEAVWKTTYFRSRRDLRNGSAGPVDPSRILDEHTEIVRRCREGDVAGAARVIEANIAAEIGAD